MALDPQILGELLRHDGGSCAVSTVAEAFHFCETLTRSHYENFPVASFIVDSRRRKYIYAIYAFSRVADDVADESNLSADDKVNMLSTFSTRLETFDASTHPVFMAIVQTIRDLNIDVSVLKRLLHAFTSDVRFTQPTSWDELYQYCSYSANPIGELLLAVFREHTPENIALSDRICTSLQLINFWQDLSRDLPQGRVYIPRCVAEQSGPQQERLADEQNSPKFPSVSEALLRQLFEPTEHLLKSGAQLVRHVNNRRLRLELSVTVEGGNRILEKSKKIGVQLVRTRPSLTVGDMVTVSYRAVLRCFGLRS